MDIDMKRKIKQFLLDYPDYKIKSLIVDSTGDLREDSGNKEVAQAFFEFIDLVVKNSNVTMEAAIAKVKQVYPATGWEVTMLTKALHYRETLLNNMDLNAELLKRKDVEETIVKTKKRSN